MLKFCYEIKHVFYEFLEIFQNFKDWYILLFLRIIEKLKKYNLLEEQFYKNTSLEFNKSLRTC